MKRIAIAVLLLVAAAGAAAYVVYDRARTPYRGYAESERYVDVPSGLGTRAIGARLIDAGVIRDPLTYRFVLWRSGSSRRLQAGEYRFDHPMTPDEVIDKIARGEVEHVKVTFPEGLSIGDMAKIFAASGLGQAADFVSASKDVSLIATEDGSAQTLEGYLFPDTYDVPRRTSAAELVRQMVARFHEVLAKDLHADADSNGWTIRQMVTLASIVEKETAQPDERPIVAAVYANRLHIGMALQCDPTVIYALELAGQYTGNLRKDDLAYDSPYNTYKYPGLPPGPIGAPGKSSLEAVAHPADVDYLYFVSRNDGTHEFAKTLKDHNRNVQKYQVQYFRQRARPSSR